LADQHPDHDSIASFRKRHLPELAKLFAQLLKLCQKAGLVKLGHVALDGTKVKANASKHKAMSYQRMPSQPMTAAGRSGRDASETVAWLLFLASVFHGTTVAWLTRCPAGHDPSRFRRPGRCGLKGFGFYVLLLILPLLALACASDRDVCDHCAGGNCRGIKFAVELRDGTAKKLCCLRCGSDVVVQAGGMDSVSRLVAHDYQDAPVLDARAATYVEGSDIAHCNSPGIDHEHGASSAEPEGCHPTLLAFRSDEVARAFTTEHGGAIQHFGDLGFGRR
jgi:hypothetical protein